MAQRERKPDPGFERAATDLAAVPLQTDAETAGTPTSTVEALTSTDRHAGSKAPPAPFAANQQGSEEHTGLWLTAGGLAALAAGGIVAGVISVTSL